MGILYVPIFLITPNDIATTINNIIEHQMYFRLSILSALTVQLVNIIVFLLLYKLLKPICKPIATTMVTVLFMGVAIVFVNEISHLACCY